MNRLLSHSQTIAACDTRRIRTITSSAQSGRKAPPDMAGLSQAGRKAKPTRGGNNKKIAAAAE
jgi:hypothetical protein